MALISGIFILSDLRGPVCQRIREWQLEFDPKLAKLHPPHITIAGSSGVGPLPPTTPLHLLRERLAPIAASTAPLTLRFGPPIRFMQSNVVSFPLDPHGPLRRLHERIATSGLPFTPARFPFTPHCTVHFFPEITPDKLHRLLRLRLKEPATIDCLEVSITNDPQPPKKLLELKLMGME